jgi:hypothetical protein
MKQFAEEHQREHLAKQVKRQSLEEKLYRNM